MIKKLIYKKYFPTLLFVFITLIGFFLYFNKSVLAICCGCRKKLTNLHGTCTVNAPGCSGPEYCSEQPAPPYPTNPPPPGGGNGTDPTTVPGQPQPTDSSCSPSWGCVVEGQDGDCIDSEPGHGCVTGQIGCYRCYGGGGGHNDEVEGYVINNTNSSSPIQVSEDDVGQMTIETTWPTNGTEQEHWHDSQFAFKAGEDATSQTFTLTPPSGFTCGSYSLSYRHRNSSTWWDTNCDTGYDAINGIKPHSQSGSGCSVSNVFVYGPNWGTGTGCSGTPIINWDIERTPTCTDGSWGEACGYEGPTYCQVGTSCDTGWINNDGNYTGFCPGFSKIVQTGNYCYVWDDANSQYLNKFNGSTECVIDSSCPALTCNNLDLLSTYHPGETIQINFDTTPTNNINYLYVYDLNNNVVSGVGNFSNGSTISAPASAGTYTVKIVAYESDCRGVCNGQGDLLRANDQTCPTSNYTTLGSGCGGCSSTFSVVVPSPTPTPTTPPSPTPLPGAPTLTCGQYNKTTNSVPVTVDWSPGGNLQLQIYHKPDTDSDNWWFNEWTTNPITVSYKNNDPNNTPAVRPNDPVYARLYDPDQGFTNEGQTTCQVDPSQPTLTCETALYDSTTNTMPVAVSWDIGNGLQVYDSNGDWWYNKSASSPITISSNNNNTGTTKGIPVGRIVYAKTALDWNAFSTPGQVVCQGPTPTPRKTAPTLSCTPDGRTIDWDWKGGSSASDYRLQINDSSPTLNADGTFSQANTTNDWVKTLLGLDSLAPVPSTYPQTSAQAGTTYYGHITGWGGGPWSNTTSCTVSTCDLPNQCFQSSLCPPGSPKLDCSQGTLCCQTSCTPQTTSIFCYDTEIAPGGQITCNATGCNSSDPNQCWWSANLQTSDVIDAYYQDYIGFDRALLNTYSTGNEWDYEVFTAQQSGKVDKIEAYVGWTDSSKYERVSLRLAGWDGSNPVPFTNKEAEYEISSVINAQTVNGTAPCSYDITKTCAWVVFPLGKYSMREPEITAGNTYVIQIKNNSTITNSEIVWPYNSYWSNGLSKQIYPNRFRVYLHPPVDTPDGYGSFTAGPNTSESRWMAPANATPGQTYVLTSRIKDSCGWGYGNDVNITIINAPTATPTLTPSPTPTQGPWKKLKDTSFQSSNNLEFLIPSSPSKFDTIDDTTESYFIIGNGGVISNNSFLFDPSQTSPNQWYISGYSPVIGFDKDQFESYSQSRKQTTTITDLTSLNDKSINIYNTNLTIDDSNKDKFDNKTLVLIVDGTVTFDISGDFAPSNASVAILANTINFYKNSNFISTANGIFIADNVNTGSNSAGLKIKGNLVVKTTFNNQREQSNNRKPSVFIVFDPDIYINLLPYLSIAKYEWRQLE